MARFRDSSYDEMFPKIVLVCRLLAKIAVHGLLRNSLKLLDGDDLADME